MAVQGNDRDRSALVGRKPMAVRALAVPVGLITAATLLAAPAHADQVSDAFLAALNNAGINYADPGDTVALGQSICPMLVQPGGSFASTASTITGHDGMSAAIAGLFTSIAISTYCPSMFTSIADGNMPFGNMPFLPQLLGVPGL